VWLILKFSGMLLVGRRKKFAVFVMLIDTDRYGSFVSLLHYCLYEKIYQWQNMKYSAQISNLLTDLCLLHLSREWDDSFVETSAALCVTCIC
jgi:hypothetical protein